MPAATVPSASKARKERQYLGVKSLRRFHVRHMTDAGEDDFSRVGYVVSDAILDGMLVGRVPLAEDDAGGDADLS